MTHSYRRSLGAGCGARLAEDHISSCGSRMGTAAPLMTRCAPSLPVPAGGEGKQGRIKKSRGFAAPRLALCPFQVFAGEQSWLFLCSRNSCSAQCGAVPVLPAGCSPAWSSSPAQATSLAGLVMGDQHLMCKRREGVSHHPPFEKSPVWDRYPAPVHIFCNKKVNSAFHIGVPLWGGMPGLEDMGICCLSMSLQ